MVTNKVSIDSLGDACFDSPYLHYKNYEKEAFVDEQVSVVTKVHKHELSDFSSDLSFLELAGPRKKIFFNPSEITCGIVTCGGLCPGINDVIRGIVIELYERYGVKKVLGFKYGYKGLTKGSEFEPVELDPDNVDDIHVHGGTILSSSRGFPDVEDMARTLVKYKIKILFTIGGDGTMRGAEELTEYINKKKLGISVIGIPKTIDNDIFCVDQSFGFGTAIQETSSVIESAHEEAKGAPNGIGLVKLMGREAGFIACYASLANANVNYCFIPECPFKLEGPDGFLEVLKERIRTKYHAVIVVAEGAGQNFMKSSGKVKRDASGNIKLKDIGFLLKHKIETYFKALNMDINLKYIDPSYTIRSVPATAMDSAYCLFLAQSAVHAGMAGKTNMLVSFMNNHYVHIPIKVVVENTKRVNPKGRLWHTVMSSTLQPYSMFRA